MPIMLTGGFRTRQGMNDALASGAVAVIGLARPITYEPDLPQRLLDGTAHKSLVTPKTLGHKDIDYSSTAHGISSRSPAWAGAGPCGPHAAPRPPWRSPLLPPPAISSPPN